MAGRGKGVKHEINKEHFEYLCGLHCTMDEIAGFFKCCDKTIQRFCKRVYNEAFPVVRNRFRAHTRINLRRKQYLRATEGRGDTAMLIWLGKNWLKQSDKVELEAEVTEEKNVSVTFVWQDHPGADGKKALDYEEV